MKKFLSMVLALAMAMSLVTFAAPAAGAKDFTDDSSIQYKEAVDVISAIQIMEGYNDASFGPTATLTRGAAAKIICNMILGPTTASALPTNWAPFPDVAAGSTFAGYIAYCAEHNIISGYADGNFRPADSLSGYAFLKMLLCALGYDQEIEKYQGANWRVNVAKQALGIGLDDGLNGELDGSRIVTREEAALYAFNTLQADMVEYENKTSVAVNGATVTVGGNTFQSKVAATQSTKNGNIDDTGFNGRLIVQFAEEYFPQLEREPKKNHDFEGGQDAFGRPSTKWTWKGSEVGTYSNKPAAVYYSEPKITDICKDLNVTTIEDAAVYLNGQPMFTVDLKKATDDEISDIGVGSNDIKLARRDGFDTLDGPVLYYYSDQSGAAPGDDKVKTASDITTGYTLDGYAKYVEKITTGAALGTNGTENGTIFEVFYDTDSNKAVICAMTVYPGEINTVKAATSSKDAYVIVTYKSSTGLATTATATANTYIVNNFSNKDNDYREYTTNEAFTEDDLVWFTFSNKDKEIGEVHKMDTVEGKLTARVRNKSVTLDGVKYDFAKEVGFDLAQNNMSNNSSYVLYLDKGGYVLWVEEADFAIDQYALVERISVEGGNDGKVYYSALSSNGIPYISNSSNTWDTNTVRLLLSSGVERTMDLDGSGKYRHDSAGGTDVTRVDDDFVAGSIVRYTINSDGTVRLNTVRLSTQARSAYNGNAGDNGYNTYAINDKHNDTGMYKYNSTVATDVTTYTVNANNDNVVYKAITGAQVQADSETRFVVKDDDNFKIYDGRRNAPEITGIAQAYAYMGTSDTPKLVFIIRGVAESNSKDIVFLAGKSRSDLQEDSGVDNYYTFNAMVNGVPEEIDIRDQSVNSTTPLDVKFNGGTQFSVYPSAGDAAWNSVILNKTTFNSDDLLTKGSYDSSSTQVYRAIGVKRGSLSDEVKVGTYDNGAGNPDYTPYATDTVNYRFSTRERTEVLANNANIYYVDDDGVITAINASEIHADEEDLVFYTRNDDDEITNLFICDYEV